MDFDLVMYSRLFACPFVKRAKRYLEKNKIKYSEILIDKDDSARDLVVSWTGFESVPTIIVANPGETLPASLPEPLASGASPRGVNRGSMITEPSNRELEEWLRQHHIIP
ncbi:MAG: glutaredoxin family protein [Chloroflexota bacterium]